MENLQKLRKFSLSKCLLFMETAAYPMYIDLFVTQHKKTDLMYTNTPIHITVCISFSYFRNLQAA